MRTVRTAAVLLTATLVVAGVAACTGRNPHKPRTTTTTTTRSPGSPLAEYAAYGGLCPPDTPGCGPVQVTIGRNGDWQASVGAERRAGRLDAASLTLLANLIEHGVDSLAYLPVLTPNMACPAAYDAQNITMTFHQGSRPVTVTNCDEQDPSRSLSIPGDNGLLLDLYWLASFLARGPAVNQALVRWQASGGDCPQTCPVDHVEIQPDGRWTTYGRTTLRHGTLDAATTQSLKDAVEAQFATLADLGPSSGCPSYADGRDIVITYADSHRIGTVANCILDFDGNALIDRTATLVADLLAQSG
jgi:hypothetical protein